MIKDNGIMRRSIAGLAMMTLVVLTGTARAQTHVPIQVDVDHASFAYDGKQDLVEVYLAFEAADLRYQRADVGYHARLPVNISMLKNADAILPGSEPEAVWVDTLALNFMVPDTSAIVSGQHFVHQERTLIAPGVYQLRVVIPGDAGSQRPEVMLQRDVTIPDYSASELVRLSDLMLSTAIEPSKDKSDPFYKNGLVIRPNANQLFGSGLDRVFYYTEAYNLPGALEGEYTLLVYIAEANLPQPLPNLERRTKRSVRSPDVIVGQFDVSALPSGSYFLRVAILNAQNEALAEQSRKFFVYNPDVARKKPAYAGIEFENSAYAKMSEDDLDRSLKHIAIIESKQERQRLDNLKDLDARRRFLMNFWKKRDPNPATSVNEFKEQFYQRVQYANDRYNSSLMKGWETDRGRTLIKYGTPAAIESHVFDRDFVPHEIWEYNNIPGEGQAKFIFADRGGSGIFELIHSTVSGERKLSNWQDELRKQ